MKIFIYLFLFFAYSCYAGGGTKPLPDYMKLHKPYLSMTCADAQTQHQMDQCGRKSLSAATKQMERILAKLKKNHKASEPGLLKVLEKSQATWENYKTTSCELETYYSRDGSGYESILNGCLESKINERISYLQWMLDHP